MENERYEFSSDSGTLIYYTKADMYNHIAMHPKELSTRKPSEIADFLYFQNEQLKKPGYRSYLKKTANSSQPEDNSRTVEVIGRQYGMSQVSVARYIRIAQLSDELKKCLDNQLIGKCVAERLSYLRISEQNIVHSLLNKGIKIKSGQADALKTASKEQELNEDEIIQILESKAAIIGKKSITLSNDLISKYFPETSTPEEIENTIAQALEFFLRNQTNTKGL